MPSASVAARCCPNCGAKPRLTTGEAINAGAWAMVQCTECFRVEDRHYARTTTTAAAGAIASWNSRVRPPAANLLDGCVSP